MTPPPQEAETEAAEEIPPSGHRVELLTSIPIDSIEPNRNQPRTEMDPVALEELSRSIQENGLIEPIIVRPKGGKYELVAGERRWRACGLAGWKEIPALVRSMETDRSLELALVENIQRADLSPVEEARAYERLAREFGRTHDEIAKRVGKDRTTITNLLRILKLPERILAHVSRGTLSVGHIRPLIGLPEADQLRLASEAVSEQWSVREIEQRATASQPRAEGQRRGRGGRRGLKKPDHMLRIEEELCRHFGTEARIRLQRKGGRLEIHFHDEEELSRLLDLVGLVVR